MLFHFILYLLLIIHFYLIVLHLILLIHFSNFITHCFFVSALLFLCLVMLSLCALLISFRLTTYLVLISIRLSTRRVNQPMHMIRLSSLIAEFGSISHAIQLSLFLSLICSILISISSLLSLDPSILLPALTLLSSI